MTKIKLLVAVIGIMLAGAVQADYTLNMTPGVTQLSRDIYDLHMYVFWISVGLGVLVYGLMMYSIINHRKSRGVVPATFHENTKLELVWTIIPFIILIAMAIPATRVMIEAYDTSSSDMTVKVTGYQWKWRYTYLDNGIDFFSTLDPASNAARQLNSKTNPETIPNYLLNVDHPLVIPANKKVRFVFTAADVIHSWWVPAFGWKKDAVPGFITDAWAKVETPGIYRGQCTELCGRDHGFMPIVVDVRSEADYKIWVEEQLTKKAGVTESAGREYSQDELMAKGKEVYDSNCSGCHQPGGAGIPGNFPAITGSPVATGPVSAHLEMVLKGKNMMPGFEDSLDPVEVAAVVTYQRNALGNSVGDQVQPAALATKN